MTSRRDFLRLSVLAASAGCTVRFSRAATAMGSLAFTCGVQLYMVRDMARKDLSGLLKAIRAIGFTQIELYPIVYERPATDLKKLVSDCGLGLVSSHFNYDTDFEQKIVYARQLGLKYMVCPMIPARQWNSAAGFREAADQFNRWAVKVHDAGMTFAFHNHCYEFKPIDGITGFDVLMKNTDPAMVKLEMDVYWTVQGGLDPLVFLKQYKDRIELLHLKDRKAGAATGYVVDASANHFTELGQGTIDWPSLLAEAKKQGIKYAFVDQDDQEIPVLDSLKMSYQYLRKISL